MGDHELSDSEKAIERYKVKKLIQMLESARGMGTSVISIYMTPKEQVSGMVTKLNNEYGTASNIKSHTNKLSVQSAITASLGRLKQYNRLPPNGLLLYCGTVLTADNKEKKLTLDIEPFKPVSRSLYLCDNKFHTEELHRMLESDEKFGFIVVDGSGTTYATLCGSVKEKLGSFTVELPKKHGRGGQSKNRFARIRMERRHNYLRKVAEGATQYFITNDRPNVVGLVLAGSAEFKEVLYQSDLFDPRLKAVVLKVVDVAHPGDVGLNQAIDLAADALTGVKLVQEKKLLQSFFDQIACDTQMYCFGVNDTMKCLEAGAVETLIVYEDLEMSRYTIVKNRGTPEEEVTIRIMTDANAAKENIHAHEAGKTQNEIEEENFVDWLATNYQKFGCTLELVTNRSQEGTQFVRGFGGIGGILRYKLDLMALRDVEKKDDDDERIAAKNEDYDFDDDFM
ncbi:eukaryotic peptide chain release factor subunit 1, putative [Trypanosoma cruzi]|uniref:Eukaryotic peptide chain release factor subunit 1 n=2 Tax=Trypanosoma cruzi TaxID=5693 RepID=V5BGE7_TRYCR|nr:eukaryotic peptide chain release factor subunit 1, putative [Trypanosoma cruzi]ESS66819.1 eukaryotic peptide chain release factor subunit 1 [Trypanosoma cruzi Dm28c]PBJ73551.1 eukaryotic peptide chain release factor subunit 1 [Trypanosoma cruzi cruzi]KAF8283597.1 putative eukaryotic peptide chain release factor subunit 1 [Trypanosoma cruzi]PWV02786.1 putative eukaryotic peptide chain release factor subunit 1 [Trypanosoma cruzi]